MEESGRIGGGDGVRVEGWGCEAGRSEGCEVVVAAAGGKETGCVGMTLSGISLRRKVSRLRNVSSSLPPGGVVVVDSAQTDGRDSKSNGNEISRNSLHIFASATMAPQPIANPVISLSPVESSMPTLGLFKYRTLISGKAAPIVCNPLGGMKNGFPARILSSLSSSKANKGARSVRVVRADGL